MRTPTLVAALALAALGACKKTGDGQYQVKTPDIDVNTKTTTVNTPTLDTRKDTINTPTVGTKPETVIVNKPVVGTKKTEVTVPTVTPAKP